MNVFCTHKGKIIVTVHQFLVVSEVGLRDEYKPAGAEPVTRRVQQKGIQSDPG
jgi:hypothetical protein